MYRFRIWHLFSSFDLESYKELKTKLTTSEELDTKLEAAQMIEF
jgi:hypothetical protein